MELIFKREREVAMDRIGTQEYCPVCAGPGEAVGFCSSAQAWRCRLCGLFFFAKDIRASISSDHEEYAEMRDSPRSLVDTFVETMRPVYVRQLSVLEKLSQGKSILDFGSGMGIFLSIARERGWDVHGIDISAHAVRFAKEKFDLQYASSLNAYKADSFDAVRMMHVLEHIPEPGEILSKLRTLIKPNGILAVIAPNCESLCPLIINSFRRRFCVKPRLMGSLDPEGHVVGFSVRSLTRLANSLGFEPVDVFTVSMGNRTYHPLFFDGAYSIKPLRSIPVQSLIRFWLPQLLDAFGNPFGKGFILVGYFRKR